MTRYRHLITEGNRKWWTLGAMCFALFMVMLDNTVVNVALPSIQRDIHAQISELEWVINGYTLTFAVLIATGGARRHLRAQADVPRRRRDLRGHVRHGRVRPEPGDADREPCDSGHRGGADDARDPLDHHARLPRRRAWQGDRDVGGCLRAGALDRPG